MAHAEHTASGLADDSKSLRQNLIQSLLLCGFARVGVVDPRDGLGNASLKLLRFGAKLVIREPLNLRLHRANRLDNRQQALHRPFVAGSKNLSKSTTDQGKISSRYSVNGSRKLRLSRRLLRPWMRPVVNLGYLSNRKLRITLRGR